jgi:hypothetical protein
MSFVLYLVLSPKKYNVHLRLFSGLGCASAKKTQTRTKKMHFLALIHKQLFLLPFRLIFYLKKLKLKSGQTFCAVDTTPTNLKFGLSVFDSFT